MSSPEPSEPSTRSGASRRTFLAEERTFLAWFRSGLAAIAVSLAVGRLLPALVEGDQQAYRVLGIGYGLLGVFLMVYGAVRQRAVERQLVAGRFVPLPLWVIVTMGVAGLVLSAATVATLMSGA
ncbi:MAG: YidH family protein [Actinomycetota bacterium]